MTLEQGALLGTGPLRGGPPRDSSYLRSGSESDGDEVTHISDSAPRASGHAHDSTLTGGDGYGGARQVQSTERVPTSVPLLLKTAGGVGGNAVSQSSNGYTGAKDTSTLGTPSSTGRRLSTSVMSQDSSSLFQPSFHTAQHRSASPGTTDSARLVSPRQLRKKVEQLAMPRDAHGTLMAVRKPNYGRVLNFTEEQRDDETRRAERLLKPFVYPKQSSHTTPCRDATVQRLAEPRARNEPAAMRPAAMTTALPQQPKVLPPPRLLNPSQNASRTSHTAGDTHREDALRCHGQAKAPVPPARPTSSGRGRVLVTSKAPPRVALSVAVGARARSAPRAKVTRERDRRLQSIISRPRSSYLGPSVIHESGSTTMASRGGRQGTQHGDTTEASSSLYTRMQEIAASRALLRARSLSAARAPSSPPPPFFAHAATATQTPSRTTAAAAKSSTPAAPVPLAAREEATGTAIVIATPSQAPRPPLTQPAMTPPASAGSRIVQHIQSIVPGKRTPMQVKTRRASEQSSAEQAELSTMWSPCPGEATSMENTAATAAQPPVVYAVRRAKSQPAEQKSSAESPHTTATSPFVSHHVAAGVLRAAAPNLILTTSKPCPFQPRQDGTPHVLVNR